MLQTVKTPLWVKLRITNSGIFLYNIEDKKDAPVGYSLGGQSTVRALDRGAHDHACVRLHCISPRKPGYRSVRIT